MTAGRSLFSPLPPAFAAVPQYLFHITVELLSLTEPDKRFSHTSGSSVRHSVGLRSTTRVQVFADPGFGPAYPSQSLAEAFPGVCLALALAVEPFEQDPCGAIDIVAAPFPVVRYGVVAQVTDHSGPCLAEHLCYAIHSGRLIGAQCVVAGSQIVHITDVVIQTGKYQARLLARPLSYPCQIRSHCDTTPCIVSVFPPSRTTNRGDLRSAGVSRLIARPLQLSGPHHSRRGHPTPSFHIARGTRVLPLRSIPQELLDRRSPGYLPAVVQLDAVLDPGVSASHSSLTRSPHGLRPTGEDRPVPKHPGSRGYVSDSGLHPSPRRTRVSSLPACAFSRYSTERLTRPYSGGLVRFSAFPLNRQPLPGYPSIPLFQYSREGP